MSVHRSKIAPLGAMTVVLFLGNGLARSDEAESSELNEKVRTLWASRCFVCHGPDEGTREGGFRLDNRDSYLSSADSGSAPLVAGDYQASPLWYRINTDDPSEQMPPAEHGAKLSNEELELVRVWIDQGAHLPAHWSFIPPQRPTSSFIFHPSSFFWKHPIDRFVLAGQLQHGLSPSPEAERWEILRRVSLDLIGLPPTIGELDAFLSDDSPDAYERQVDRLLASPLFGEHWARKWLDLARYADSAGYADDPDRTIWAYRDWVIHAINENMPIDQFTIEQLAGDLLPDATTEQLVATAFHRNTLTNNEGGTNDEEFRNVAVVDRVNTTMAVWMGVTFSCAQCHSHKYDPFSQHEYFQVFAIFNQTQDADVKDESPTIEVSTDNPANSKTTVPVLRQVEAEKRRETRIHLRGDYKALGDEVHPGVPAVFHPIATWTDGEATRLDLAKWLVDDRNPLTARVWVNRIWESLFGLGIVRTSEEFGTQGEMPSHPELLDWLATELVAMGWDFKAMLRLIVTSQTYRQSSRVALEQLELDRDNVWLSRGPRVRLSAEMVRDSALQSAGLLSSAMYGAPVLPPQPNQGLKAAFGSATDWTASEGENRYRRGIYTKWRRSNPYPSMATFDAPSREVCILRRDSTNTPLQALVTLNDPAFVEAAQSLARRLLLSDLSLGSDEARLIQAFRSSTSRYPSELECRELLDMLGLAREQLAQTPDDAMRLATDPLGALPEGADAVDVAAWTAVCNVLLNLDEVLMKR